MNVTRVKGRRPGGDHKCHHYHGERERERKKIQISLKKTSFLVGSFSLFSRPPPPCYEILPANYYCHVSAVLETFVKFCTRVGMQPD